MPQMNIFKEITPLRPQDIVVVIDSVRNGFDYPIHNHPEYEINLIMGISGTRIVGDSTERYSDYDLVLLGPYLFTNGTATNKFRKVARVTGLSPFSFRWTFSMDRCFKRKVSQDQKSAFGIG